MEELEVLVAFRTAFEAEVGVPAPSRAFAFGDSASMRDELAQLVLAGRKRATAALAGDLDHRGGAVPQPGDRAIVLDGRGEPVCVIETTSVEVAPFHSADEAFAWDEGEGDRSLAYWIHVHRRFFTDRCAELGWTFSDGLPVVFERFEVVWAPPEGEPGAPG